MSTFLITFSCFISCAVFIKHKCPWHVSQTTRLRRFPFFCFSFSLTAYSSRGLEKCHKYWAWQVSPCLILPLLLEKWVCLVSPFLLKSVFVNYSFLRISLSHFKNFKCVHTKLICANMFIQLICLLIVFIQDTYLFIICIYFVHLFVCFLPY